MGPTKLKELVKEVGIWVQRVRSAANDISLDSSSWEQELRNAFSMATTTEVPAPSLHRQQELGSSMTDEGEENLKEAKPKIRRRVKKGSPEAIEARREQRLQAAAQAFTRTDTEVEKGGRIPRENGA